MPTEAPSKLLDGIHGIGKNESDFFQPGDQRILGWIREGVSEGDRINKDDPAFGVADDMMDLVIGRQKKMDRPSYLPSVIVNRTKKAVRTHASALTDVQPLFAFKTENTHFEEQSALLNKLVVSWWINTFADVAIADVVKYASTVGTGDLLVEYDPNFHHGTTRIIPKDFRDTLPLRPSRDGGVQNWMGLILREAHTINALRNTFPFHKDLIVPDSTGRWGQVFSRFRRAVQDMLSPAASTLDGLKVQARSSTSIVPEVNFYRVYLNDSTLSLNKEDKLMGPAGANWAYMVKPGDKLYPRKRLILATERAVLYDGPAPSWHPYFPICRLKLESYPWQFLGLGIAHDLKPLQEAINSVINDILMVFGVTANRGIIADQQAIPEPMLKRLDVRKPGWRVRLKASMGEGFKLAEPPVLPGFTFELLNWLIGQFDDLAEISNLQQLLQLRQAPGADTIKAFQEALTPGLRMEARQIEFFLRELAEMWKGNTFQYESQDRRVMVLGDAGKVFEDFDFDPATLVPSLDADLDKDRYIPQLDKSLDRGVRARYFMKQFAFLIAPNSLLALHAQERQMMYLQLSRMGYLDFWTLMDMLDIPNVGAPPVIPLPVRDYDPSKAPTDPMTGAQVPPPMELRIPSTITERLQAQMQMWIGQTQNPAGRKASGQEPPEMESKDGGERQTVTES